MGSDIPPSLRALARFQGGVVTRQQALASGMPTGAIVSKVRYGRWQQLYRGVYATFTGPVNREAQLWAAILYAGKGALLSHQTAAEVHGLADHPGPLIHVAVPANRRVRPAPGMVVHISPRVLPAGFPPGILPRTSIEDTILDLVSAAGSLDDVCEWVTRAFGRRLTGEGPLRAAMSLRGKLRWRTELGEIVTAAAGGARSVLEFRYDRDVERAHGLPAATRQVPFTRPDGRRGYRDRRYDRQGLVVELDGKQAHPGENRRADASLGDPAERGGATLRYGWEDVTRNACQTAAQVAEALRARGWRGRLRRCSRACRGFGAPARRSA